jgi:kynurenine formamidase
VIDNGPPVTRAAFDALATQVCNWQRWPNESQRGALNFISPECVKEALATARLGRTISLGLPWNGVPGPDNAKPALHYMTELGDVESPEPTVHKDFIGIDYHGKASSHLDALAHIAYRGELFAGVSARSVIDSHGARHGAVTNLQGIVGRGVLIDMPRVRNVEWLEPGSAVHRRDILMAESELGVHIRTGDVVLLRSGHVRRRGALGAWNSDEASAGLHADAMPLIYERQVSVLGADGDSDVRPSPVEGVTSPIHVLALTMMGVPLLDNLDLEELAEACAAESRWEFLIVVSPLNVPGGTGSPVNPVAVL